MKTINTLIKLAAAIAAIAGIAYLVVKYLDTIKAWISKLCPCCAIEEEPVEEVAAEEIPAEEAPAEEAPAEEVPAEEAPVEDDGAPVAEDADFEA